MKHFICSVMVIQCRLAMHKLFYLWPCWPHYVSSVLFSNRIRDQAGGWVAEPLEVEMRHCHCHLHATGNLLWCHALISEPQVARSTAKQSLYSRDFTILMFYHTYDIPLQLLSFKIYCTITGCYCSTHGNLNHVWNIKHMWLFPHVQFLF